MPGKGVQNSGIYVHKGSKMREDSRNMFAWYDYSFAKFCYHSIFYAHHKGKRVIMKYVDRML